MEELSKKRIKKLIKEALKDDKLHKRYRNLIENLFKIIKDYSNLVQGLFEVLEDAGLMDEKELPEKEWKAPTFYNSEDFE